MPNVRSNGHGSYSNLDILSWIFANATPVINFRTVCHRSQSKISIDIVPVPTLFNVTICPECCGRILLRSKTRNPKLASSSRYTITRRLPTYNTTCTVQLDFIDNYYDRFEHVWPWAWIYGFRTLCRTHFYRDPSCILYGVGFGLMATFLNRESSSTSRVCVGESVRE